MSEPTHQDGLNDLQLRSYTLPCTRYCFFVEAVKASTRLAIFVEVEGSFHCFHASFHYFHESIHYSTVHLLIKRVTRKLGWNLQENKKYGSHYTEDSEERTLPNKKPSLGKYLRLFLGGLYYTSMEIISTQSTEVLTLTLPWKLPWKYMEVVEASAEAFMKDSATCMEAFTIAMEASSTEISMDFNGSTIHHFHGSFHLNPMELKHFHGNVL